MRLGRCFRSLALTQVILEPSDLNSSSYASMFYVSSSFFVSAAWPVGLLDRPIDTATEFAARGPDRSTAGPKRSTRRKRSLAAPACRSHALHANRCTAHDRRGHWRCGG